MNDDAPFETVDHALKHAFASEAKDTTAISQFINDLRGGSIKASAGFSIWDHIAQAGLTIHLANRTLMLPEREFMIANYTLPIGGKLGLVNKKELSCKLVSFDVYEQINRCCDRWFVNDVVRGYCGLSRQHTDRWWADHLGIKDRQIYYYKGGRDKRLGIITLCDILFDKMLQQLENTFYEAKLVQYDN